MNIRFILKVSANFVYLNTSCGKYLQIVYSISRTDIDKPTSVFDKIGFLNKHHFIGKTVKNSDFSEKGEIHFWADWNQFFLYFECCDMSIDICKL